MVQARGRVVQLVFLLFLISSSADGVNEVEEEAKRLVREPPPTPPLFIKPPFHLPPLRLPMVVEGVIYCRSCKLRNYDRLLDASPLPGAVAELRCNNSRHELRLNGTTNADGYFLIQAPMRKVTTFGSHKCKVFLMSSPLASCNRPSNLSGGVTGAYLRFERITKVGPDQSALFAAGYFEFSPAKTTLCPHLP
ncbi:non-classical arabinogalactan protein 31-like isoform X1 [Phoenix dactylifera]|uniref:Non-classical arabinogalactan protein 31-like isoform X1 n=1 Tax=Phoenix dactylifera TaxID=42345 RepID=A0A8B8J6D5_PHODC|nr:non-classical arabinogalactan protein 31-like isoform X1 [Phoenix dactylifera]